MSSEQDVCPDFSYARSVAESLTIEGYEDAALKAAREEGHSGPVACWAYRGCSGLKGLTDAMEVECPHSRQDCYSPCPAECKYTVCSRPWHKATGDFNLIFDETVDRYAAIKKNCYTCEYFLKNGPRLADRTGDGPVVPSAATRDSQDGVTIHLF